MSHANLASENQSPDTEDNNPIAPDGILKDPYGDRGVSYVGSMLGLTLTNGNTFWVYATDIRGMEEITASRLLKLYIEGKTSPVYVASNAFELSSAISKIRDQLTNT